MVTYRSLLKEGVETKNMSAAKHYIYNFIGSDDERRAMEIIGDIKHDIPNSRLAKCKFMLGIVRMFFNREFNDASTIDSLNATLKLVSSDKHINEFDRNLNGVSCNDLIQMFSNEMSEILDAERKEINGMEFSAESDYDIVRIDSFEQASEYSKYTTWCVTDKEEAFDNYTNNGCKQFYFCLKHGFENVPAEVGEGCPLDEYGLSMLAVLVNENGSLAHCTCRWNHDNKADDNVMNAKEISKTVGVNFYETFKPNNKWKEVLSKAVEKLSNGVDLNYVFEYYSAFKEGFAKVKLNGRYNFLTTDRKILSDTWFDYCNDFKNGFARVELNSKENFITADGKILSDTWFDYCDYFENGLACVKLNSKQNFLATDGNILSNTWFDACDSFDNGFAIVVLNNKWNFLATNGKLLSDTWFNLCNNFKKGFARVGLNGEWNFITTDGKILSDTWFDGCDDFKKDGFAIVELNDKYNLMSTDGKILSDTWFDRCTYTMGGFYDIKINGKYTRFHPKWRRKAVEGKVANKDVILTEGQFAALMEQMQPSSIITESQESKSIHAAKKLAMQRLGYDEGKADEFIRKDIRGTFPALRTPQGGKFMLGVVRMYCDGELRDATTISALNSTLQLVSSDKHINEFDRNLNGVSYNELIQMFSNEMSETLDANKKEVSGMKFTEPSDYDIVRIDSFEQASEYRKYTTWCVTDSEGAFDNYTNDGFKQFYFCLKHGFEGVPAQTGKGCPLDEYGLSMLAVLVNEDGSLANCTCRWNHNNGGNDSIMNTKEISSVIGVNFYETFKPNNTWKEAFSDAMEKLAKGANLNKVFDKCGKFKNGLARVELNHKYNFLTTDRKFLSDTWFDYCYEFVNGLALVELNGKWNFLTTDIKFLSDTWFDDCDHFKNGFSSVWLNNKWNFLTTDGQLLSDTWFDNCYDFEDGFARVKLNGRWYKLDANGVIIKENKSVNKDVMLTEEQFATLMNNINESQNILLEGGDSRLKPIKNIIRTAFEGTALNPDDYVPSAEYYVPNRGEQTTWMHYLIYSLRHRFDLMGNGDVPLLRNVAKIAFLELNFEKENQDLEKLNILDRIIQLIKKDDESKLNFVQNKDVTFSELYSQYKDILQQMDDEQVNTVNSKSYELNSNYEIVPINDFYTAREYGEYTGADGEGCLCYTTGRGTWDSFTNNGRNQCYLCYLQNYKEIPPREGEGYPKDEYGLSMIWLFVNEMGRLVYSNVRWNHGDHSYNNVDKMFTESEISDIVGVNFYETFKPNSKWQDMVSKAMKMIAKGADPNDVFDDYQLLRNGYAVVKFDRKWNYITPEGEILSKVWFDYCYSFRNGVGIVELDGKNNYLAADGKIISDTWFDYCGDFKDGIAKVGLNDKYNFLTKDGNILSDAWFDYCHGFENGFAKVELNDKQNFINAEGKIISDTWFDFGRNFENGVSIISLDDKYNVLRMDGTLLSDVWLDMCYDFHGDMAVVQLNEKWNFLKKEGGFLFDKWFDSASLLDNGEGFVTINGKCYMIDKNGNMTFLMNK